jgi:hypothetical protein
VGVTAVKLQYTLKHLKAKDTHLEIFVVDA